MKLFLLKIFTIGKDIMFIFHPSTSVWILVQSHANMVSQFKSMDTVFDDDMKRTNTFIGPVEPKGMKKLQFTWFCQTKSYSRLKWFSNEYRFYRCHASARSNVEEHTFKNIKLRNGDHNHWYCIVIPRRLAIIDQPQWNILHNSKKSVLNKN